MTIVPHDLFKEFLAYDPDTGVMRWKKKPCDRIMAGAIAGTVRPDGYIQIRLFRKFYMAHRIAFLLMTGRWPHEEIDHINCDRANNRWSNLREATRQQNQVNQPITAANKSGLKGVSWHRRDNRWMARIRRAGKATYIGIYDSPEEAHAAYIVAARALHGEFARAA